MKITIESSDGVKELDVEKDLGAFYAAVGEALGQLPIPNTVQVSCEEGTAAYEIGLRGGTRLITRKKSDIKLPQTKPFPERYLVMVNADHNNYKFYRLKQPVIGGDITASWGLIGARAGEMWSEKSCQYPADMFWVKYFEKTSKGYEDKSDFYIEKPVETADTKPEVKEEKKKRGRPRKNPLPVVNEMSIKLYALLKSFSRTAVKEQTTVTVVTQAMIDESKRLLGEIYKTTTVNDFNELLLQLLAVAPRKVSNVSSLLARSNSDFPKIISREESLVDALEALVPASSKKVTSASVDESFDARNIEVFIATDKQKEQVMRHLPDDLQSKVKNVYRVIPKEQEKKFKKYLETHHIETVKQFWHGSRNENWLSIIINSLLLKPNAVITGKMFGNGIYFAPKASKSWNYTSYHNTYWAKGNSSTAFMGLYATAYGIPLDCTCSHHYTKSELGDKNCVHAHAGSQLRNDEIIFYDEAAVLLQYVVEFGD